MNKTGFRLKIVMAAGLIILASAVLSIVVSPFHWDMAIKELSTVLADDS